MLNSIRKLWSPGERAAPAAARGLLTTVGEGALGDELKTLVTVMAKALVDKPDAVDVTLVDGEQTTVVELRVAKEDLGKVIGKEGRTARSLRTILSAASTKLRKRTVLEIIE